MLDDVQCSGSENQLLACTSAAILTVSGNCDHSDDAGVRCEGIYTTVAILYCHSQCNYPNNNANKYCTRPVARIFRRAVTLMSDMNVCLSVED